jgi:stage II sporulation protein D
MRVLAAAIAFLVVAPGASAGTVFVIDGRGWGHGVGMSQWGAEGYARHGWSYKRILGHYYPHTRIEVARRGDVRVLLLEKQAKVRVSSPKPFRVLGATRSVRKAPLTLHAGLKRAIRFEPGAEPLVVGGRAYRGAVVVQPREGKLIVVNDVPLDLYVRGVVPYEMPRGWSAEAYNAQTVVARSYALAHLARSPDFDLYADARSQVYGGVAAERPETNLAVGATAGRVLTFHGAVVAAYYFSSSGGWTASAASVWRDAVPYLVAVRDPYDTISPYHHWGPYTFTLAGLRAKLHAPRLVDAVVVADRTGRAKSVRLVGPATTRLMDADAFRRALGLRSTALSVRVLSVLSPVRTTLGSGTVIGGVSRGLGKLRVERRTASGAWAPAASVRQRDGLFRAVVRVKHPGLYRVAAPKYAAAVELRLGGVR